MGTAWNIWLVMGKRVEGGRHTGWDRSFLESNLGVDIANRLGASPSKCLAQRQTDLSGTSVHRLSATPRWYGGAWATLHWPPNRKTRVGRCGSPLRKRLWRPATFPSNSTVFPFGCLHWRLPILVRFQTTLARLVDDEFACFHDPQAHPTTLQHVEYADPVLQALVMPQLEAWLSSQGGGPDGTLNTPRAYLWIRGV